jgi:hypothetical protein
MTTFFNYAGSTALAELKHTLDRGLNTQDNAPKWLLALSDLLSSNHAAEVTIRGTTPDLYSEWLDRKFAENSNTEFSESVPKSGHPDYDFRLPDLKGEFIQPHEPRFHFNPAMKEIGRASCRERV